MAKFVFRLQSFLNVKGKIEEQKKLEYGKALQKLEEEKNKLQEIINETTYNLNKLREKMTKGITPVEIRLFNQFLVYLDNARKEQLKVIENAKKIAEVKRLELVEAMKERKMLETLREKDYENYIVEEKLAEQKIVDEIVSFKYNNIED